jgi:beta-galactosidase
MFDCWTVGKNRYDYHLYFDDWSVRDTEDTVLRDRNHPSIILYSAGNEIHDTPNAELSKGILAKLLAAFHTNDPTRPVTQALFRPNASHDYDDGLADMLDVVGQNYRENEILAAHAQNPSRKIIGTENGHALNEWLALRDNPPYAGQFLWTGADYLGESRNWPVMTGASGLLDRTDATRARGYQRQSWWNDVPAVHITRTQPMPDIVPGGDAALRVPAQAMDWTPSNMTPHNEIVEVYSNCPQVELFLNGTSLGAKPRPADDSSRRWTVIFAPGTLRAVGMDNGKTVATDELRTAGPPAKIVLSADRTTLPDDWDDVNYVRANIVDANGIAVPNARDLINFSISGPGALAATDNADVSSHDGFQSPQRHAYQGTCIAVLRASAASGAITLTASAPGLTSGTVKIQAAKPSPAP